MMLYNFVLMDEVEWSDLAQALADIASVPVEDVDVGDADDPDNRNWTALVLCGFRRVQGDSAYYLDVTFIDAVAAQPPEGEVAARLADRLGILVAYPGEMTPPHACWLAAPSGRRTRASFSESNDPDVAGEWYVAVEERLPLVPDWVPIAPQTDVISSYGMDTPVADEWCRRWAVGAAGEAGRNAHRNLSAWESLAMRMASNWPPDGWCPAGYYQDLVGCRDRLASAETELELDRWSVSARREFADSLAAVDELFREHTSLDDQGRLSTALPVSAEELAGREWWWQRIPSRPAWSRAEALADPEFGRVVITGTRGPWGRAGGDIYWPAEIWGDANRKARGVDGHPTVTIGEPEHGDLTIRVLGREHPGVTDFGDGNWVTASIDYSVGQFSGTVAARLRSEELDAFRAALTGVYSGFGREAPLKSMEEWLALRISVVDTHRVRVLGALADRAGAGNRLNFEIDGPDRSHLRGVIDGLDQILDAFPVVGASRYEDLYGCTSLTVDELVDQVSRVLEVELEPHDSDAYGEYARTPGLSDEGIWVQPNHVDYGEEVEIIEDDFPDYPVIVVVRRATPADDIRHRLARSIPALGFLRRKVW